MDQQLLSNRFVSHFGTDPEVLVRAPGRINLIGEHTDYNAGLVLPGAIQQAIWIAIGKRTDATVECYAIDLQESIQVQAEPLTFQQEATWANYLLGVIQEFRQLGQPASGFNIAFGGDIPTGAGLSSSAAMVSGMALALNHLYQHGLSKMDLVKLAQRAENTFVGMKCGIMDMFASVMGKENQFIKLDCRSLEYQYFPSYPTTYTWLLLDSGVKHRLVESAYNTRREECEQGVAILNQNGFALSSLRDLSKSGLLASAQLLPNHILSRCLYVVEEIARVEKASLLLATENLEALGALLTECHVGLDQLYEVCVPETNFLVDQANSQKTVLGARQMGGGFGGCVLCLVQAEAVQALSATLSTAYHAAFGLPLATYPVQLGAGAAVLHP